MTHFTQDYYVQQREKRYGPTLDAMTPQERIALLSDRPILQAMFKRAKDNWLLYRPELLLVLENQEKRQQPQQTTLAENW